MRIKAKWMTARLLDDDADLMDWWDSIPEGERSETLKAAARTYIADHAIEDPTTVELARLRQVVEAMARKIEQGVIVRTNSDGAEAGLDEAQAARRREQILKRKW